MRLEIKTIGASGQLSLGKEFAGRIVTVEKVADGIWTIKTAQVIPDDELWLNTPEAKSSLDRALAWSDSHPRRGTALKPFAKKIGL